MSSKLTFSCSWINENLSHFVKNQITHFYEENKMTVTYTLTMLCSEQYLDPTIQTNEGQKVLWRYWQWYQSLSSWLSLKVTTALWEINIRHILRIFILWTLRCISATENKAQTGFTGCSRCSFDSSMTIPLLWWLPSFYNTRFLSFCYIYI